MDAESLAQELVDSVNSGINPDELTDELATEHRWLQREVFNQVVKPIICENARLAEDGAYDARNEDVVQECKEIADAMGWHY